MYYNKYIILYMLTSDISILGPITQEYNENILKENIVDETKKNVLGFFGIKWIGMMYVAIIQIVSCLLLSKIIKKMVPSIKKKDSTKKELENYDEPIYKTILYSLYNLALILLGVYIMRNITQNIPFPLDGIAGYKHSKLREINGIFIANFVLLYYQNEFLDRLKILFNLF